ncbi:C2H2 type zinc finger domain-containing protein [Ophiocordyceps camponoti-floridani]|uniref:C2H2 type zinc finger domain-containing protein n=1 Tax=Ophiocordyceps camponoti-floridani TaxID=2030778 RepID=A0A8H4Q6P1_9HYPO|nr:C2H2 type zinc finger domain-containing protein [Ophiocordyceps camponoti-floridani]
MQALRPKLELSPSPSPDIPAAQIRPSSGDAVLVSYLDNGRRPEIARFAGAQALPGADEDDDDDGRLLGSASSRPCTNLGDASHITMSTPILQHLAADALQVVSADSPLVAPPRASLDISTSARQLSISDERPQLVTSYPSYRHPSRTPVHADASTPLPASAAGELPPLQMDSPKSETNGQNLPSIRSTFGDIKRIHSERATPAEKDMASLHSAAAFSHSPPLSRPRLPPMSASHVSPPISPSEAYQRSLPSPHSLPASSPYNYYHPKGLAHRPSLELGTITAGDPPGTDQSVLTPATSASVADPMSIDGITNPSSGIYACTFSGCTAPPFQTQYLLNSHANVHSSARPHYCMDWFTILPATSVLFVRIENTNILDLITSRDMFESTMSTRTKMTHCCGKFCHRGLMGRTEDEGSEESSPKETARTLLDALDVFADVTRDYCVKAE